MLCLLLILEAKPGLDPWSLKITWITKQRQTGSKDAEAPSEYMYDKSNAASIINTSFQYRDNNKSPNCEEKKHSDFPPNELYNLVRNCLLVPLNK